MTDDFVFCAKTGRMIVEPPSAAPSNVIPFPRRRKAKPEAENPESYVDRVTITHSATFEDIDNAARAEVAALAPRFEENDDI